MRIALLTYSTRPRGSVVHTLALAEALHALGEDVTVVGLGRSGDTSFYRDISCDVRVVPLADVEAESLDDKVTRSIAALGAAVDVTDFDVLHAQDCIAANAVAGACVRTVHHLDAFSTPALVACHDRAIRLPHTLVCVSPPVADEVAQAYGRTAAVVPNGVDAERFTDVDPGAVRRWRDRLGGAPLIAALGGIEPRKGTADLVEAVALLGPGARLAIAGGETLFDYREYRDTVLARAADLDIDLEVLGPLPQQDVAPFLACADVVAMPSTKEGFGLAALEALAAGTPVVLRDLPVLRHVFASAARYATDVPSLAAQLIAAAGAPRDPGPGRALARSLTWDAAARAHLNIYRNAGETAGSAVVT